MFIIVLIVLILVDDGSSLHLRSKVKGEKDDIRQAYLPSLITFAMDMPSFGLDGEYKWVDYTNANERIIDLAKVKMEQDYWNNMFHSTQSLEDMANVKALLTTVGANNAKPNYKIEMDKLKELQEKQRKDDMES